VTIAVVSGRIERKHGQQCGDCRRFAQPDAFVFSRLASAPGPVASLIKAKEPRAAQWPTRMRRRSRRSFAAAHRLAELDVLLMPRRNENALQFVEKGCAGGEVGTGSQAADSGCL
jgi:hypothetical protein